MQTVNDAPDRASRPGPRHGTRNMFSTLGAGRIALLAVPAIVLAIALALLAPHVIDISTAGLLQHSAVWLLALVAGVLVCAPVYRALHVLHAAEPDGKILQLQLALQQSQAQFQNLVDLSSHWYWEQDAEFRFSFPAVADLVKNRLPPEALAGKRRRELPITHIHEAEWEQHRLILAQRRPFRDYIYRVIGERGELRWFSISGEPMLDAEGDFKGYRCAGTDVTDRKQTEQRQNMEHIVTRVLAESESLSAAVPQILRTICQTLAWDCGAYWEVDGRQQLRCAGTWSMPGDTGPGEFMDQNRELTFASGQSGLIRLAMVSEQPAWISDVASDPTFKRAAQAAEAGLHGALAFPLQTAGTTIGVMEFFSRHVRQPDAVLLDATRAIGAQIGQFIRSQQADEARRASEARLSGIIQSAMHAIIMADEDMKIVLFNPAAEKIFGHAAADMAGARIERLIPGRFWHAHSKYVAGFGASKTSVRKMSERGVITGLRANGEEFPGEASISHITLDGRKFYTVILSDISARVKTEESLHLAATAIENAQEGIVITDTANRIISVNPAFTRITGYTAEEVMGCSPGILSSGMQDKAFYQQMWDAIDTTGHWQGEVWDKRKSGELYCELLSISVAKNPQGKITHHTAIFTDITGRKNAEQALRAANERLEMLIQSSPLAIYTRDVNGLLTSWNPAAEKLYGWTAEEVLGRPLPSVPEDQRAASDKQRMELLAGAAPIRHEVRRQRRDGSPIDIDAFLGSLRDADGNITGIITVVADVTERKQAEAARAQLAAIVENSNDAIISRSFDGTILTWNAGAERIFGYSASEATGRPISFNALPGRTPIFPKITERILRGEAIKPHETRRLTRDGQVLDVLSSVSPIKNDAGQIIGIASIFQDITALKRAEADRARLAAIVQGSDDTIFSRTLDGIVTSWNAGAERMFGYTASEAIGQRIEQLILPPEMRERVSQNVDRVRQGERVAPYETRRMTRDGRLIDVLSSVSPIRDDAGRVVGASVILHDISALKRAEAERSRLAAIVENSNDAIMTRTLDGIITSWNAGAERMLGYSAAEAIGKPAAFILLPDRSHMVADNTERVIRGEIIPPHETRRITRDGRIIDVLSSHSPIRDDSGKIIGASVILNDIAALKQAQEQVILLNAELEQRVLERTRQLEATNKELESFSYSVSHDLRAPLRSINGFSKLLLNEYTGQMDARGSDYLKRINRSTQRMGELIDDLLKLSKVARHQFVPETLDLSQLAASVLEDLREREPERAVATEIEPGIAVQGDPRLLRIMLENLLGNAWKFTRKTTHPQIRVWTTVQEGKTVIAVGDNGAGFDMEYADKLFGAFQRLHRETEFEGTGIGLATVQRIVTLHGGRVWAESAVGKGAVFYLML